MVRRIHQALSAGLLLATVLTSVSCAPRETKGGAAPAIEIATEAWNFGRIERGERATTRIPVRNRGQASLRLSLSASCECVAAAVEPAVVPPRGSAEISVSFLGDEVKDEVAKTIYLDSNDPTRPRIAITLRASVVEGKGPHLIAFPSPLPVETRSDSGSVSVRTGTLKITNRGPAALAITAVRCFGCTGDWSQITLRTSEEAILHVETLPDWQGKRWLEIESNDPVSPVKQVSVVEMD